MSKKNIKIFNYNSLTYVIIALFLVEFLATLLLHYGELNKTRLVGYYKLFFQVIILLSINYKNLNKKILVLLIGLGLVFSLNQILNPLLFKKFNWLILKGSIYYFDRYIIIILFALMIYSRRDGSLIINKSLKITQYILLANLFFILLGVFTKYDLFKSYPRSLRFGFDGLFNKVNELSHIYCIYITYLYYNSVILKSQSWNLLALVSIFSLLLGTKLVLLFLALLFVFHFIFIYNKNKSFKSIAIGLILIFIVFFKEITRFVFDMFPFWDKLKQEHELITLLLSKRDYLFYESIDYISESWSFINYLIGGTYYTHAFAFSQMDGPDLFLFFGTIGTIIYMVIFTLIFFKKDNIVLNGLLVIILICGFLGGALLMSPYSMVLLFLVSYNLNAKYNLKKL